MKIYLAGAEKQWSSWTNTWKELMNMKIYLAGTGSPINNYLLSEDDMKLYLAESGGIWEAYMKAFIAGTEVRGKELQDANGSENVFEGTYILQSFYYVNNFTEKVIIPSCKSFLLDSGAFTFFNTGKHVDWNEYIERYADFINRNNIDLFFELDIDSLVGYENVLKLRNKLEILTGKKPIPVWHVSRGKDEFIRMCEKYPYVALGGIVSRELKPCDYKMFPWFIKTAHDHGAKIHGLGFTNLKGLTKYHFDSVDSTSWVSANRFGSIYKFNGTTMEKFDKQEGQRLASSRETALHNFKEWIKFQQYADKWL